MFGIRAVNQPVIVLVICMLLYIGINIATQFVAGLV